MKEIATHKIVEDESVGDLLYWKGNAKGKFSIKSALQIIRQDENNENDNKWEMVGQVRIQQRIKMFMWLALHDRLLCNANRVKRQIASDPGCPLCAGPEETLLHLFRECPSTKNIWNQVGGAASRDNFFIGNFMD